MRKNNPATVLARLSQPDERGCIIWSGTVYRSSGYGRLYRDNTSRLAHRVAWELAHGPIPDDLQVLHRCDVRRCVNPAHLFLGTPIENMADRDDKGRQAKGSRNGWAKLTEATAAEIFCSNAPSDVLARRFGLGRSAINRVRSGRGWSHVTAALKAALRSEGK